MDFNNNDILIKYLQKGNEKAYLFLIEKYHKKLNAYVISLSGDHAMAQDIIQNVFIKTWEYRERLNKDYSIQNFLYKSAYNEFITAYNKKKSMSNLEDVFVKSLNKAFVETNEDDLERILKVVNDKIEELPPKCKKIFTLSKKDGLTNLEISEHLDISIKTVEGQITKAFKILRIELTTKIKTYLFFLWGFKSKRKLSNKVI
ncbi:RNA polymerase sigma factor [Polaribacter sp. Q13]|uniref:RNA polymerase sigma factor n=1 Tax=Polaribacter sp. Q13 TaxID=2806551 RepID=UPI00193B86BD|nr:sigma-70 family RNA polymerase sigma factor [Polaribacter sp. Q13]QVY65007.1 sigma-70 family RNA polymerase sigma factor [Polaribacter sp. Q13]